MVNSAIDNLGDPANGTIFPVQVPQLGNRYNVNVPIADAAGRFALAVLENDFLVDLELTALEAEGRGEIVSTPRVITANQKEARIEQGVEIPYQQSASSGATTVQFKKAVLSLTVTPQITPDNNIIMDLAVHKDNVGDIISTGGLGGTVPSIDTRAVETRSLLLTGRRLFSAAFTRQSVVRRSRRFRSLVISRSLASCLRANSASITRPSCLSS